MKGKDYFNWFDSEDKIKWLSNFHEQKFQKSLESFMERDFKHYFQFFFLSFEFDKSIEGKSYWIGLFHKYKKYDNVVVKPGYGAFGFFPLPKPKFSEKN